MLLKSKARDSSLLKHIGKLSCTNLYNISVDPNAHSNFFSSLRPFNLERGDKDREIPMPLKPQSNSWSIPYPIGMQHCICNRREEGGITSHQSQVSSQSRGRMQAPNLAQELICLPHTSQAKGKPREGRNSSPWGSTGLVGSAST